MQENGVYYYTQEYQGHYTRFKGCHSLPSQPRLGLRILQQALRGDWAAVSGERWSWVFNNALDACGQGLLYPHFLGGSAIWLFQHS